MVVTLTASTTKRTLAVRIDQPDRSILGWVGLLMLPSQRWILVGSYDRRMFDRIASELAARADAIEALPRISH